jgi:hypothetical protein
MSLPSLSSFASLAQIPCGGHVGPPLIRGAGRAISDEQNHSPTTIGSSTKLAWPGAW